MIKHTNKKQLLRTVDDVADYIIAELMPVEQQELAVMDEQAFQALYAAVAHNIIDEFELWSGNDALLNSCFNAPCDDDTCTDPAHIILQKVQEKLRLGQGVVIIT